MSSNYRIFYENSKYGDNVEGLTLPMFIHNGTYFHVTLDIYADGVAECWGLVPINGLQTTVDSGWITTEAPLGSRIGIHDLGGGVVEAADWHFLKDQIVPTVQALFDRLNPVAENLFDFDARRKVLADEWGSEEIYFKPTRMQSMPYRLTEDGKKIPGAAIPLFEEMDGEVTLTACFAYADQQLSLGYDGELLSVTEMQTRIDEPRIRTAGDDNTWINLPGLGRFKVSRGYWNVEKAEMWKMVVNKLNVLSGRDDVVEICYQAFLDHQTDPTDANRELLRAAYEAVPDHYRVYTQRDMDAQDHDIRQILGYEDD